MISQETLLKLKNHRCLLALSGGRDSMALFHILHHAGIVFDTATVNYNLRPSSHHEALSCKALSQSYHKKSYLHHCYPPSEGIEAWAREERYLFFQRLCREYGYNVVITAHHLQDRLEWFLIRFSEGSGLAEILGFKEWERREDFLLVRPLSHVTPHELIHYLEEHNIQWFHDESNDDMTYTRNYFRHTYANEMVKKFGKGIKKSFDLLSKEESILHPSQKPLRWKECYAITYAEDEQKRYYVTQELKRRGIVLSYESQQRLYHEKEIVFSGIAVSWNGTQLWVAPYCHCVMPRHFREMCRIKKIPSFIRAYLWQEQCDLNDLLA